MVLHPQECGRVGRRRTFFPQGHPTSGAPEAYFRRVFALRNDLAGIDWAAVKADLRRDGFDNGRTPDELYRSFAASAHTSVAWIGDRVVGTARLLADGICNAYLVDVWTAVGYPDTTSPCSPSTRRRCTAGWGSRWKRSGCRWSSAGG